MYTNLIKGIPVTKLTFFGFLCLVPLLELVGVSFKPSLDFFLTEGRRVLRVAGSPDGALLNPESSRLRCVLFLSDD